MTFLLQSILNRNLKWVVLKHLNIQIHYVAVHIYHGKKSNLIKKIWHICFFPLNISLRSVTKWNLDLNRKIKIKKVAVSFLCYSERTCELMRIRRVVRWDFVIGWNQRLRSCTVGCKTLDLNSDSHVINFHRI